VSYLVGDYIYLTVSEPEISITVKRDPIQSETSKRKFTIDHFNVEPLYDYSVQALVLSKKEYTNGKEGELSKYDLALGWKEMSKMENVKKINITQRKRWYFWKVKEMFMPRKDIEHNSANHHIIPSNKLVELKLEEVNKHDVVELKGHLVKITDQEDKQWFWKSSTSRTDTGDGACELFYVTDIVIVNED
jgi:hypothetical protein